MMRRAWEGLGGAAKSRMTVEGGGGKEGSHFWEFVMMSSTPLHKST